MKHFVNSLLVGAFCLGCTSPTHDDREEKKVHQHKQETEMSIIDNPVDAWWAAFKAKSNDISALFSNKTAAKWDLPGWMKENLQQIHPQLMWEFGPAIHTKGHRLVITPESRRDLRPLVSSILKRSPRIDGWEFYGYRLAEDFDMAIQTVQARTGGDIRKTSFRATIGNYNMIDLLFFSEEYSENDQQTFNDVFVATEALLGEELLDKWIGGIEINVLPKNQREDMFDVEELKARVDALIEQIHSELPQQPYHRLPEEQQWTLFELKPEEQDDYTHQRDMFVGKSMIQELWENAHSNQAFDSIRFSKHGEIFCYIKIDGTEILDEEMFADKGEIEDALDTALRRADIGCFIGGGTGLKYSYVDLALLDVERGASIIKKVLREGKITKRSWILFFDTDLQARWIGLWDDSPPPPLPDFE